MELLWLLAVLGIVTVGSAAVLGYFFNRFEGAIFLAGSAGIAVSLCIVGYMRAGGLGLVSAAFVVGLIGVVWGRRFLSTARASIAVPLLWYGYCAIIFIHYWTNGWIGVLAMALPSLATFWIALYHMSQYLVPPPNQAGSFEPYGGLRRTQFRSLLTFLLGTNYPYLVEEDGKVNLTVSGNPEFTWFAGPGIILLGPHYAGILTGHAASTKEPCSRLSIWQRFRSSETVSYVSDEERAVRMIPSGLSYTHRGERLDQILDLRPQVLWRDIEALTTDGISVRVRVVAAFRVASGDRQARIDQGIAYGPSLAYDAILGQSVARDKQDQHASPKEEQSKSMEAPRIRTWDQLVAITAAQRIRSILGEYEFDDLYALEANDQQAIAVEEIRAKLVHQLREILAPVGIELISQAVSVTLTVDDELAKVLIANWQERVRSRERARQIQQALEWQAEAKTELVAAIAEAFDETSRAEDVARSLLSFLHQKAEELGTSGQIVTSSGSLVKCWLSLADSE